ncbi:MAG: matrixin family metalloprotease [Rhizobiales bacterium]|nr:matrixin family metalloprotease [Hyphomicrobiales bacterium]
MQVKRWASIALIGLLTWVVPAMAGDYRLLSLNGSLVKWGKPTLGSGAVVTYTFATKPMTFDGARNCASMAPFDGLATASGSTVGSLRREVRVAFDEWEKVAGITFREVPRVEDAGIVFGAQGKPTGWAFSNVAPVTQLADKPVAFQKALGGAGDKPEEVPTALAPNVDSIRQSLICLNPTKRWKIGFDGNLKVYDIRHTFAHEIGHAIGLDHPGASGSLMGFRYDEKIDGPQAGDIAAVQRLYGPPRSQP